MAENNHKTEKSEEIIIKKDTIKTVTNTETNKTNKVFEKPQNQIIKQESELEIERTNYTLAEIKLNRKIENTFKHLNQIHRAENKMINDTFVAEQKNKTADDGFLSPVAWLRQNTIEKISFRKSEKLMDKNDLQPMFAYTLKETLGADLKIDKSESKTKYYFGFKNFSIEN